MVLIYYGHFMCHTDHFYQAHGRCGWKSDGTTEAFMSHAYDGKDFVSFDVSTRTWTAAVSHAVFYKRKRETDLEDLVRLVIHYESGCIRWLKKLLQFSVTFREPKGNNTPSTLLTGTFCKTSTRCCTYHTYVLLSIKQNH